MRRPHRLAPSLTAALAAAVLVAPVGRAADDPLGTLVIAPGAPVTIGAWGDLSGSEAPFATEWMNAAETAIAERGGTLAGHPVRLVRADGACTTLGGAQAAATLLAEPGLAGLLGGHCSDETEGGVPPLSASGLSTISPASTRQALTAADRGPELAGFLRTAVSDGVQGALVAEFAARTLGRTTAATISDGSSYADGLVADFAAAFAAEGGEVVATARLERGGMDPAGALAAVAPAAPEVLYFATLTDDGAALVRSAGSVPGLAGTTLIGADGVLTREFVAAAGPAALGVYISGPTSDAFADTYPKMRDAYAAAWGAEPTGPYHAQAWDAAGLLLDALGSAAVEGADGSLAIGRGAVRDALFATRGVAGVTGTLTCTATGDCAAPIVAVTEVTQDVIAGAWPPPIVLQEQRPA
ncbi:MAG: branched-chain amino acid ABC transporter substrate-binding protein [Chloroflexota bacterium]